MAAPAPRILIVLAFLAFISLGLPDTLLGVAWASMRETFSRPISDVGYLLACGTMGYLVSSFLGGAALQRLNVGPLLAGSCAIVTLSLTIYALSPVWPGLFVAAVLGGIGAGAIDAGVNAFGARTFSPRVMNWLHGFWGVGATLGPLAMTAAIAHGYGWRPGYGGVALVMVGLTLLFSLTMHRWREGEAIADASTATAPPARASEAIRSPAVLAHLLFYFVYSGVEFGAGTWLFTFLRDGRGTDVAVAGAIVSSYWAALTAGRMIFGQVSAHVRPSTILRGALAGAVGAVALLFQGMPFFVTCAGAVLLGFSVAPLYPTVMALTPARVGERFAGHAVGFQVSAAALGIMVNPWLIGLSARHTSIEVLPYALLVGAVLLLSINEFVERLPRGDPVRASASVSG